MKKALAMILALVMVFSLGVSALAVDATTEHSTVTDSTTGLTVLVSKGVENLEFVTPTHGTDYEIGSTITGYFPQNFSLMFSTGTGVGVTSTDANVHFEFTAPVSDGYGAVSMGNAAAVLTVTNAAGSFTIYCPAPVFSTSGASGIAAYLPAPAQFVNEGVTVGGWGDAFTSTAGSLKPLVNASSTTGVSLGSFGGYVVLDFGAITRSGGTYVSGGIYNDPTNAYGVDFILYGNALSTWAEPGCVQVSQDGTTWYDIAGSLHYRTPVATKVTDSNGTNYSVSSAGAVWNYTATYTDPKPTDQTANTTAGNNFGTYPSNPTYTFNSITRPGDAADTGSATVAYNAWHRHTWFPLTCNYFRNRTVAGVTQGDLLGKPLANLDLAAHFGTVKGTNTSGAMTLAFNGVKLMPKTNDSYVGSTTPDDFLFGYADCHINGTVSGEQVNPYTYGRSSGGDPIDISWAVKPNGDPIHLDAIRYVRVYTGVQQLNGMMGESSTEITAAYTATKKGATSAVAPEILFAGGVNIFDFAAVNEEYGVTLDWEMVEDSSNQEIYTLSGLSNVPGDIELQISGGTSVLMNGERTTEMVTSVEDGNKIIQIINQSGEGDAFITLLKLNQ